MARDGRRAGPVPQTISVGGPVQKTLDAMARDRADANRVAGLDPSLMMLLPLVISLARLAARHDARETTR